MKYTSQIIVKVSLEQFVEKYNNHQNLKHWHRGLKSYEHISGDPGKIGSKMKFNYNFEKRNVSLLETVTKNNLPHELHVQYDTKGMHNVQQNYFEKTDKNYTKWICKSEFIATSFFMRIMTLLSPKSFKKQTMVYLNDFKNFAEKNTSVLHA